MDGYDFLFLHDDRSAKNNWEIHLINLHFWSVYKTCKSLIILSFIFI
jgi:hypothetical protein